MDERFGCDTFISLATLNEGEPAVRIVNSYYEKGSFYTITHALSNKMHQIGRNPAVAICGEWFTATRRRYGLWRYSGTIRPGAATERYMAKASRCLQSNKRYFKAHGLFLGNLLAMKPADLISVAGVEPSYRAKR